MSRNNRFNVLLRCEHKEYAGTEAHHNESVKKSDLKTSLFAKSRNPFPQEGVANPGQIFISES